jgi:hypothetical protein
MHSEPELARLWRGCELHLERDDVEGGFALVVEWLLVESLESKWRYGDLALPVVRKEQMPSRCMVACVVWRVGERNRMPLWLHFLCCNITFGWVNVQQVGL